ncbi:MAG: peptidoglycan DD-metalloendopeptidase family protein [Ruminococcus sp.]
MSENNSRRKRSRYEKAGFYTALSICLIAVTMAVYSTYNTISGADKEPTEQTTASIAEVNNRVTGVTETAEETTLSKVAEEITVPTIAVTVPQPTEPSEQDTTKSALQTMLSTELSLGYPLNQKNIIREFSEKTVYYKSLNVWKSHLGVDFAGEIGDEVTAMTGGAVINVEDDKLYGKTVKIATDNAVVIYSGLNGITVNKGDSVENGQKIGVIGTVPCEVNDKNHIHIAVKIDGQFADPLSFINNGE